MKPFCLLVAALVLASVSCERHDFEETRKLHEHGSHAPHAQESENAAH